MSAYAQTWASIREALEEDRKRESRDRIAETTFLPAALELIEKPVSPLGRRTAYVLLAGLVALVLWLVLGSVDIVASANGKLSPQGSIKMIQPAEAGIVRRIYVKDGQKVTKGQLLVELDPTVSGTELGQSREALLVAELTVARARAVLDALEGKGFRFVAPQGATPQMIADHSSYARAQLSQLQSQSGEQSNSSQASALAAAEARTQARKIAESLPLLDQQLQANEKLLEKGYVSKLRVLELRRQRLAAERDREAALQTAARAAAEAGAARNRGAGASVGGRADLLQTLITAEAEVVQRRGELAKASQRAGFGRIVAPVSGTVSQLAVHTEGGMVEALRPIMAIVPNEGLTAEAMLSNSDVGFVRVGQEVAVKVHAYPYSRHGTIPGKVVSVGADAVADEQKGLVYPVRVQLNAKDAKRFTLRPGMEITVDVRTGSRRLIDYLISPIESARTTAARER